MYDMVLAAAYLRPEMIVAVARDMTPLVARLTPLVAQVVAVAGASQASLDAVFASVPLSDLRGLQGAIPELVRRLKPGGRLVLIAPWQGRDAAPLQPGSVKARLRAEDLVNVIVKTTFATGSRRVSGASAAVQQEYDALAVNGRCCGSTAAAQSSCCAPASNTIELSEAGQGDGMFWDTGYTAEQIALAPAEAANLSLGCGNPIAMASLRPGETVLDIGSGAGIDAFYAARRVGPQGRVIGLDMTPTMIARARRSTETAGLSQVEFRLGQAEAMPVEDDTVDVILSNCVINLAEDKGRVFEEAYRVLKPGGQLSISDMVTAGPLPMSLRGDPALWAGCLNGALPEREYLDLVRQAGFSEVVGQRGLSSGVLAGVAVYSLSVSARKA